MEAAHVELPEVNVDPVGDMMVDWLIDHDREEPYLDFKETLDISKNSPFPKIAKDIFAFSNYGSGFILLGFRHKSKFKTLIEKPNKSEKSEGTRNYVPVGLTASFHVDQATLQEKFNAYSEESLIIEYREFTRNFDGIDFKLAIVYIHASTSALKPIKNGSYTEQNGKKKNAFDVGQVLFRRGTQSVPATKQEISFIERRSEKEQYRISILSGNTDRIVETIYSNLLEVIKLPETVWTAMPHPLKENEESKLNKKGNYRATFVEWDSNIVTFDDLSNTDSPLWEGVIPTTIRSEGLSSWIEDPDKQRVLIHLLNRELRSQAYRMGLAREERRDKFYYECFSESRVEIWKSRYRDSSQLTVAQRMWASQLKKFIFWHLAVIANFTFLDSLPFLRLSPSLLLTEDGRQTIFGSKEGTVITRLTYNRYNSTFLNNLLFWISRISGGAEKIELAQGKVVLLAKLCESKIDAGILSDRPTAEELQEEPIIEISGEE